MEEEEDELPFGGIHVVAGISFSACNGLIGLEGANATFDADNSGARTGRGWVRLVWIV